jgi:hydrogenase maturation factor
MDKANFSGDVKQLCLEYISEVNADDYVLVHFRFALCKVDEEDAAGIYWLLKKWIGWQSGRPRQSELRRED